MRFSRMRLASAGSMAVAVAAAVVSGSAASVRGHTILVAASHAACVGARAHTIQQGVDMATAGDTVLVCPGMYAGGVRVNKANLTIRAYPLTHAGSSYPVVVVPAGAAGPTPEVAFTVLANGVTIEGFEIAGFEQSDGGGTALLVGADYAAPG
jgi:pectin methylesterase-like acyl-CoA thioesterase